MDYEKLSQLIDEMYLKYENEILNSTIDCTELAEWLVGEYLHPRGIKSEYVVIKEKNGKEFLIKEGKIIDSFLYHQVVLVGKYIIDIRHPKPLQLQEEYKAELEELNRNIKLIYEIV